MEEWKSFKLGDIASVQTGPFGSQLHNEDYVDNGTPIVTVEHLGSREFSTQNLPMVSNEDKERLIKYSLKEGDIVFSRVGSVDRCSYVGKTQNGWLFSGRCLRVRAGDMIDPLFLYYYFQKESVKKEIRNVAVGATMPSINTKLLSELNIEMPSKKEQERIAEVLSSIDDKIELNNRINHNLEEEAHALYKSWFVVFEPFKDGKFVESELGMIPEGWSAVPFMNIARLCSGGTPKTDIAGYWNGDIPFFTPKDVKASPFCLLTEKKISQIGLKHCNSQLFEPFTTFITARGTVGKLCMAGIPMAMNQTNYAIRPVGNTDPILLFIMSKQIIASLKNKANGAVFDAITTRDFDGELIINAPQSITDRFVKIIRPIYEKILENERQTLILAKQRDSVLPKIMSGKLGVITC